MTGFHVFLIVALETTRKVGLNPNCLSGSSPSDSDSSSLSPGLLSSSDNTRRRRSSVLFPLEDDGPTAVNLDDDDADPEACGRKLLELLLLLEGSGRDFEELDDEEGRVREFEPPSLSFALELLVDVLVEDADLVEVFLISFFLLPPELVVLLPFANETEPFGTFAYSTERRKNQNKTRGEGLSE